LLEQIKEEREKKKLRFLEKQLKKEGKQVPSHSTAEGGTVSKKPKDNPDDSSFSSLSGTGTGAANNTNVASEGKQVA